MWFGLNAEGKFKVTDDYLRLLKVIYSSSKRFGIKKYIAQLMQQKNVSRTHPTCGLKTNEMVRWWEQIGAGTRFYLFVLCKCLLSANFLKKSGYISDFKVNNANFSGSVIRITEKGIAFVRKAESGVRDDVWEAPTTDMYRLLKCSKPSQLVNKKKNKKRNTSY